MAGRTEAQVFDAVGLPWIAPELREARGEIEAARRGQLPRLIELSDIRGDLQIHTRATDGVNGLAEMVEAARKRYRSHESGSSGRRFDPWRVSSAVRSDRAPAENVF
jgi:hypothetical protein